MTFINRLLERTALETEADDSTIISAIIKLALGYIHKLHHFNLTA